MLANGSRLRDCSARLQCEHRPSITDPALLISMLVALFCEFDTFWPNVCSAGGPASATSQSPTTSNLNRPHHGEPYVGISHYCVSCKRYIFSGSAYNVFVAQWIESCYPTWKVHGSSPTAVIFFVPSLYPFSWSLERESPACLRPSLSRAC